MLTRVCRGFVEGWHGRRVTSGPLVRGVTGEQVQDQARGAGEVGEHVAEEQGHLEAHQLPLPRGFRLVLPRWRRCLPHRREPPEGKLLHRAPSYFIVLNPLSYLVYAPMLLWRMLHVL